MAKSSPPAPAYHPSLLPPPTANYPLIASTHNTSARHLLHSFTIPPRSGHAWYVPSGCIFRLSTPEGPQVGDLNIWNARNPDERFWAARTRQLQSSHVGEGDRLWSCLPWLRPLCGVVSDGCGLGDREEGGKGETRWGGRCHDLLGTRCDPYVNVLLSGTQTDHQCHSNLYRAITLPPFCHPSLPLPESTIHDVLNVFQVTGLDEQGRYFMEASPATPDSFIEFFAEQDLICALSTCPGGDLSKWGWGEGDGMTGTCRPIGVEVWEIVEGERERVLKGWEEAKSPEYKGDHGVAAQSAKET